MPRIKIDLVNGTLGCNLNRARNVQHIPDRSLNAIFEETQVVGRQVIACPDHQIMGQLSQQDHHFLSRKAMLVATRQTQAVLIAFVLSFKAAAAQIVEMQGSQEPLFIGEMSRFLLFKKFKEHPIREGEDQGVITPTAILFAFAHDKLAGRARIGMRAGGSPDLSIGHFGVGVPGGDGAGQFDSPMPVFGFNDEVVAAFEYPFDVFVTAPPPSTRKMVRRRLDSSRFKAFSASSTSSGRLLSNWRFPL